MVHPIRTMAKGPAATGPNHFEEAFAVAVKPIGDVVRVSLAAGRRMGARQSRVARSNASRAPAGQAH